MGHPGLGSGLRAPRPGWVGGPGEAGHNRDGCISQLGLSYNLRNTQTHKQALHINTPRSRGPRGSRAGVRTAGRGSPSHLFLHPGCRSPNVGPVPCTYSNQGFKTQIRRGQLRGQLAEFTSSGFRQVSGSLRASVSSSVNTGLLVPTSRGACEEKRVNGELKAVPRLQSAPGGASG